MVFNHVLSDISVHPPVSSNDHCTVETTLTFKHSSSFTYQRQVWSYKTADIRGFKQALQAVDWDLCFHHKNIDLVYREWTKIVLRVAKQFIPNKVITVRLVDKPWYNGDLRRAKRKKDRAHSKAKMYNTVSVWVMSTAIWLNLLKLSMQNLSVAWWKSQEVLLTKNFGILLS